MKRFLAALLTILTAFMFLSGPFLSVTASVYDSSSAVPSGEEFWYQYRDFGGSYTGESEHETIHYLLDGAGRILDDGRSFHVYDRYGYEAPLPLTYRYYDLDGSCSYKTNSEGLVSEVNIISGARMNYRIYYDADGRFSEASELMEDGTLLTTTAFTYDAQNRLKSADTRINPKLQDVYTASSLYTYQYNPYGQIMFVQYTGYFNEPSEDAFSYTHTYYEYDADKRLVAEITNAGEGTWVNKATYLYQYVHTYDAQGRLSETRYQHGSDFDPGAPDYTRRYLYDETAPSGPDSPSGGEEQPVSETVKLIEANPESGGVRGDICSQVFLYFDHEIERINFENGNIWLCDAETDQAVYSVDYSAADGTMRNETIRILADWRDGVSDHRKNCLWWRLPNGNTYETVKLERGHTYYLRIDEGFLSFRNTDQSFSMGFSGQKEWTWKLLAEDQMKKSGNFTFASSFDYKMGTRRVGKADYTYSSDYFTQNSYYYDSHLALLSMDMAIAAYNKFSDYENGSEFIENFFIETGFDQDRIWTNGDYHKKPEDNTAGIAIASRTLSTGTTLIALAVRGGNYEAEWAGDFYVGAGTPEHKGFGLGRDEALKSLGEYIEKYNIEGHIKIWIAGYSRASAITNLIGAALDDGYELPDQVYYELHDIFAYGFEVPASTTDPRAGDEKYGNIYSIVNPSDPVPRMPLNQWGFRRYGKVLFLPSPGTDLFYKRYLGQMQSNLYQIYGSLPLNMPDARQQDHINSLMRDLCYAFPSREIYVYYQDDIMNTVRGTLGKGEGIDSLDDALVDVLGWMILSNLDLNENIPILSDIRNAVDIYDAVLKDAVAKKTLLLPHYAEFTLAWMQTLEGTGVLECTEEPSSVSPGSRYGKVMVKYCCPVDIEVYGPDGSLLSSITGDVPFTAEDSPVEAYVDEDGAKVFAVPKMAEVSMTVKATGNGSMQVVTQCEELLDGSVSKITQYNDLPLVTGEAYRFALDTGLRGVDYEITAEDPGGRTLTPDLEAQEDGIPSRTVSVGVRGSGAVLGAGSYPTGTRALLRACPMEGETFEGWFDESGKLIDRSVQIVVSADSDRSITARFSGDDPKESAQPGGFPVWAILLIVLIAAGGITGIVLALVKNLGAPKRVPPR